MMTKSMFLTLCPIELVVVGKGRWWGNRGLGVSIALRTLYLLDWAACSVSAAWWCVRLAKAWPQSVWCCKYYAVPNGWEGPLHDSFVVHAWGTPSGRAHVSWATTPLHCVRIVWM